MNPAGVSAQHLGRSFNKDDSWGEKAVFMEISELTEGAIINGLCKNLNAQSFILLFAGAINSRTFGGKGKPCEIVPTKVV